ncbi:MAG: type II toxin-antitoxin system prevent-host-death family antitoxin [Deltaproteobacteria bacterium]|nr:type II toxin-antitoxin system prevent-host-death family antitoxin [Deltaproteobacteria bacterium]
MKQRVCNTAEAKAKLNQYLNDVVSGGEVLIERRGKVVAKLVPASGGRGDTKKETLQFMTRLREFQKRLRTSHGPDSSTVELLRELRQES